MFTIPAEESLRTDSGFETVFLYLDESGESIFYDLDVKHEVRAEDGEDWLIETHYLGWPLKVRVEQADAWRRTISRFYEMLSRHGAPFINTGEDLRAMAMVNEECQESCMEYERVQREMREEFSAQSMARLGLALKRFDEKASA